MCDILCALPPATAAGRTLVAKNSDRPPQEAQAVEWFAPRTESVTRATHVSLPGAPGSTIGFAGSRPTWAWGVEHGVSEAGVAAGNEAIYTTLDPRPEADGLPGIDLVRLCLERAATAAAGVEVITTLLEAHGQGGSGHDGDRRPYWSSFLVADPMSAFVIETSGREWAVEEVSGTRALSNRTTIPTFDADHRHPRQPVATLVDPRLAASRVVLAGPPLTVAAAESHLREHVGGDDGWTVCMHVDGVEATTAALVAELPLPADGPPVARFLLGSPCRSAFVPLVVGEPFGPVPDWSRFASVDDAALDRLRAVEAGLEAELPTADDGWNDRAWARVAAALDGPAAG